MKIFVVIPHKYAGCGFYRQYQPHNDLAKKGIDVLLGAGLFNDDGFAIDADIIQWHKGYFDLHGMREANKRGIITVVDFDDWWRVDTEHVLYDNYLKGGITDIITEILTLADYATVTTERLAVEARKFNRNVVVLPNAMEPVKSQRIDEDKLVFGYIGGYCHGKDVEMLRGLNNKLSGDYKFRLMGYDGSPVYDQYVKILSDDGRKLEHFDWVEKADIWHYHNLYNFMDVSLVPLVDNKFNSLKSELKLIEAGFFKKAVICSNVHPYKALLKHKVNAFVVNKPADWYKGCKFFIDNPAAVQDFGEALYETVQPYHIDEVNKKRLKFYEDVLKKRDINSSIGHSRLQGVNG